jgi:peptidoglycan/LPS O-acetylase OafA/YrhL
MESRPQVLHFSNIDVLRGLAALAVCFFHFCDDNYLGANVFQSSFRYGYYGVDVFFVISGFVIPLALHRSNYRFGNIGEFLIKRWRRLYPAYVATILLAVGLWVLAGFLPGFQGGRFQFDFFQFFSNLILTSEFAGHDWYVPVFWTLAIECQYYVLLALSFPIFISQSRLLQLTGLAAWIVAPLLVANSTTVFPWTSLFAMGIIAYLIFGDLLARCSGFILFALSTAVTFWQKGIVSVSLALVTICLILLAPQLKNRALIWLGTISYSVYLLHVPIGGKIINLSKRLPDLPFYKTGAFIAATIITVVLAYLFHRFIEAPSHRWAKRATSRTTASISINQPTR